MDAITRTIQVRLNLEGEKKDERKDNENNRSLCVLCFNYHSDFWT